jgi:hypothetical protein
VNVVDELTRRHDGQARGTATPSWDAYRATLYYAAQTGGY